MEIVLGSHYNDFIVNAVKSGKYSSASDVFRKAILLLEIEERRIENLRSELSVGETSPMIENFNSEVFLEQIHKKYL